MRRTPNILTSLRDHWQRLSTRNRWLCLLTLPVLVAWALLSWTQMHQQTDIPLFSGQVFTPRELTRIEAALAVAGLSDYRLEQGTVRIPRGERAKYVAAICDSQALPDHLENTQQNWFDKSSPFETSQQRDIRLRVALEHQLANSIGRLRGLEDARVHIDEALMGEGLRKERRVKAIVIVQPAPDVNLEPAQIRSIQSLVAAARVELNADDVTVTDLSSGVSYVGDPNNSPILQATDAYALRKRQYEQQWSQKIRDLLGAIPKVQVAANVDLTPAAPAAAGDSNGPPALVPSRVAVTVSIPDSYYHRVWRERSAAQEANLSLTRQEAIQQIKEEIQQLVQESVLRLLPVAAAEVQSQVAVVNFPDLDQVAATSPGVSRFAGWALWALLAAALVAGVSIRGLIRDVRELRLERQVPAQVHQLNVVGGAEHAGETPPFRQVRHGSGSSGDPTAPVASSIHEELTHAVRENPQAAADMLKAWVKEAS